MCEGVAYGLVAAAQEATHIPLETFLTIVLTALAVMLAILAIGIAAMAIWGYRGMKEHVVETVNFRVDTELKAKIAEYPAAVDLVSLFQALKEKEAFWTSLQAALETPQEVTFREPTEDIAVANASNRGLNQVGSAPTGTGFEQIKTYPGDPNASTTPTIDTEPPEPHAGGDNPETPTGGPG
jgi:hypothetical protein